MKIETDFPHAVVECPESSAGLERPSGSESNEDSAVARIRDLIQEGRRF